MGSPARGGFCPRGLAEYEQFRNDHDVVCDPGDSAVTAPTPAEVFGQFRSDAAAPTDGAEPVQSAEASVVVTARADAPPLFFAAVYGSGPRRSVAGWRARARDEAAVAAERLAGELARLRQGDESDLDLRIESYRRAAARLDDALDAFDDALADPAGPPVPEPTARDL